jgi:hypothetical protein
LWNSERRRRAALEDALRRAAIDYECQTEKSPQAVDPVKQEILEAVKRWY